MGKQSATLAVLVCALVVAGPVRATDYNDDAEGLWDAPATWNPSNLTYPQSGDTATLDSHKVFLYMHLKDATAPDEIILAGGKIDTYNAPYRPEVYSPITVEAASELRFSENGGLELHGAISDGTTTGVLTVNRSYAASKRYGVYLYAPSPDFSGGWSVLTSGITLHADGALGTGTVTVDGPNATLAIGAGQTGTVKPAVVVMNAGNLSGGQVTIADWDVELNDGTTLVGNAKTTGWSTWTGGTCKVTGTVGFTGKLAYNGDISGSGLILVSALCAALGGDNSGFSGAFDVVAGSTLRPDTATALGTGSVYLAGTLDCYHDLSGGFVRINGGTIANGDADRTLGAGMTVELTPAGGGFSVGGASTTLTVAAMVTGDGALVAGGGGSGVDRIKVTNAANDYSGGTSLDFGYGAAGSRGELLATADGVLGTGTVSVLNSRLVTDPALGGGSVADAIFATAIPVVEVRGGTLELKSTENDGKIHLYEGGALINTAGNTNISYGPSGTIHVHDGAILHPALPTPTAGQIESPGQVYLGTDGVAAGTEVVISGIVKGLATIDSYPTISGTVSEAAGNGIGFCAQPLRSIKFQDAKLLTAGAVDLAGGGGSHGYDEYYGQYTGFTFAGANNLTAVGTATVVNMNARARLYFDTAAGLPATATLNLNNGATLVGAGAGGAFAGTVNVKTGGVLYVDKALTDGVINLNGGGIYTNQDLTNGAGATYNLNSGKIGLNANSLAGLPTDGSCDFVLTNYDNNTYGTLTLGDNTRLTTRDGASDVWAYYLAGGGVVTTAGSQGRISTSTYVTVEAQVDMAGKKLIVGDANNYMTFNSNGMGLTSVPQNGIVDLLNNSNLIGSIDIQAGTLRADDPLRLGGATDININAGAELYMYNNTVALTTNVTGGGMYNLNDGAGTLTLTPAVGKVAAISPGSSVGILTVEGNLNFGSPVFSGGAKSMQEGTADYSYPAYGGIDAVIGAGSGWCNYPAQPTCEGGFEFVEDVDPDGQLIFIMGFNSDVKTSFGQFRLSVTTADRDDFCDGLDNGGDLGDPGIWTVLIPSSATSAGGMTLSINGTTGLITLSGAEPFYDTYTVAAPTGLTDVTGVRIDQALGYSGYFVWSDFVVTSGAPKYAEMRIDVTGDGGTPGEDNDHLIVTGNARLSNGELVLNLPVPSKTCQPANINATFLTAGSITGSFVAVSLSDDMDPDVAAHWSVTPDNVDTSSGTTADLVLTGTCWTAHKGDADLNDEVDVLDLAKLANNFGRKDAGVNWTTADFDFNGEVDVLDLAAIANAFGWKVTGGGEGGAPVPEPMTVAVLALGGAVLIRRRRR